MEHEMGMRGRLTAVAVTALALAIPATADAKKIKHRGSLQGVSSAKVSFAVKKKNGKLVKVSNMRFRNLPVSCDDGASGTISAAIPNFRLRDSKRFTRRGPIRGPGINNGQLKVQGKLMGGGKRAKGTIKITFRSNGGSDCGTGKRRWKTR